MAVTDRDEVKVVRDDAQSVRDTFRKDNLEERLQEVVEDRPGVQPFLEVRPLVVAVTIAAVLTLVVSLLLSPTIGAVVLVLSFAVAWIAMSGREYSRREPTSDYDPENEDTPGKGDKEVAPYSS